MVARVCSVTPKIVAIKYNKITTRLKDIKVIHSKTKCYKQLRQATFYFKSKNNLRKRLILSLSDWHAETLRGAYQLRC
jgi:hypothetical protein